MDLCVGLVAFHTSPLVQPGTGDGGGLNVYVAALSDGLVDAGHRVHVFTRQTSADQAKAIELKPGLIVHHIPAGPFDAPKDALVGFVAEFVRNSLSLPSINEIDVFHGHYWLSGQAAAALGGLFSKPVFQTFHTLGGVKNARLAVGDRPEPAQRIRAEYWLADHADGVLACAPAEALWLTEHAPRARVKVVEPGVDLACFSPPAVETRAPWEKDRPINLLFAGRLQPLKAPDVAIRSLTHFCREARLTIVGGPSGQNGMTPEHLMALATDLGVADRVTCHPPVSRPVLATMMAASDLVVVPSYTESFGLVALEAQACATPVVASDIDGLMHVLGGHRGGILVPVNDAAGMAWAVEQIVSSAPVYRAYQERAIQTANRFSWTQTVRRTIAAYTSAIAPKPG